MLHEKRTAERRIKVKLVLVICGIVCKSNGVSNGLLHGKEGWRQKKFGRFNGDLIEKYKCENAETILLAMGAIAAESKIAIDNLRKEGYKIGLARIRTFRPFPIEEIIKLAKKADLIVIDRNISCGYEGALFTEVKSALYNRSDVKVTGFIAGLGGKDVPFNHIMDICKKSIKGKFKENIWYGFEEVKK